MATRRGLALVAHQVATRLALRPPSASSIRTVPDVALLTNLQVLPSLHEWFQVRTLSGAGGSNTGGSAGRSGDKGEEQVDSGHQRTGNAFVAGGEGGFRSEDGAVQNLAPRHDSMSLASFMAPDENADDHIKPLDSEEIPDDFFDSQDELSDDELYSLMLNKNLRGTPGLPPLKVLREMDSVADEKAARRELERLKQEAIQRSRVQVVDDLGRSYATGRRKCSVARVWLMEGEGKIIVNGSTQDLYFPELDYRAQLLHPFLVTSTLGLFDVRSTVAGGGRSGQAGAMRHGISKALQLFDPTLRPALKAAGFLTRDPRVVERKKPGKAKARKSFQWVKR